MGSQQLRGKNQATKPSCQALISSFVLDCSTSPEVKVGYKDSTNRVSSSMSPLHWGSKQCCPLWPVKRAPGQARGECLQLSAKPPATTPQEGNFFCPGSVHVKHGAVLLTHNTLRGRAVKQPQNTVCLQSPHFSGQSLMLRKGLS